MQTSSVIDKDGFRLNVGIVLLGQRRGTRNQVLWGKRLGNDHWQFPQGGLRPNESAEMALYRELNEELGLSAKDVVIVQSTARWLKYRLPKHLVRHYRKPVCIGQKQKWFLLRLRTPEQKVRLDLSPKAEFDSWCWVDYWLPPNEVISFKQQVYLEVLKEFEANALKKH